jgi:predicted PurR-regulated permease PerM
MTEEPPLIRRSTWLWLALGLALAALLYLLRPILFPFLFAAILAYVCLPLVRWLDRHRLPRTASAVAVLLLVIAALALLFGIVLPLLVREITALVTQVPGWLDTLDQRVAPWINEHFGTDLKFDLDALVLTLRELIASSENIGARVLTSLKMGGLGLLGLFTNLVLLPIVMFFLMRDWEKMVARIERLIPRRWHDAAVALARECDHTLGQYLHGQVLVLLVMSVFYTAALWFTGLDAYLPIGIVTGLLTFVPFVGATVGFVLATLAAFMQFGEIGAVAWVWAAFLVGQTVESNFITPKLVGGAIGLHPLAVIFALLAFGQLFGFTGLLIALPASAVLAVAARHLVRRYHASEFYNAP